MKLEKRKKAAAHSQLQNSVWEGGMARTHSSSGNDALHFCLQLYLSTSQIEPVFK